MKSGTGDAPVGVRVKSGDEIHEFIEKTATPARNTPSAAHHSTGRILRSVIADSARGAEVDWTASVRDAICTPI